MARTPCISVILPIYNGGVYLREAVQSILDQSYKDFELIIINDGSKDESWRILQEYGDSRIRLYDQENQGLVATLNRGIDLSNGKYIARMDQDDYSKPNRLEKQIDFLEQHKDIGVLGTTAYIINERSEVVGINPTLLNDAELKLQLTYQTPFAHGSVMLRRSALSLLPPPFYRKESGGNAEDYDFWSRLAPVTKFANLSEPLYGWRDNPTGMSNSQSQKQATYVRLISQAYMNSTYGKNLLLEFSPPKIIYANELMRIHGVPFVCKRKDSYAYLLYRLSLMMWNNGTKKQSASLLAKAFFSNPMYFLRALL